VLPCAYAPFPKSTQAGALLRPSNHAQLRTKKTMTPTEPYSIPRPPKDEARAAAVEALMHATQPSDPVLSALCRLLRSVLNVPFASECGRANARSLRERERERAVRRGGWREVGAKRRGESAPNVSEPLFQEPLTPHKPLTLHMLLNLLPPSPLLSLPPSPPLPLPRHRPPRQGPGPLPRWRPGVPRPGPPPTGHRAVRVLAPRGRARGDGH